MKYFAISHSDSCNKYYIFILYIYIFSSIIFILALTVKTEQKLLLVLIMYECVTSYTHQQYL